MEPLDTFTKSALVNFSAQTEEDKPTTTEPQTTSSTSGSAGDDPAPLAGGDTGNEAEPKKEESTNQLLKVQPAGAGSTG